MSNNFLGELRLQEPLARYTSWQVGGIAKQYYRPVDVPDLTNFLCWLPVSEPVFWLGKGSNVLIRDGGFPGTVIHIHNQLNNITVVEQAAGQDASLSVGDVRQVTEQDASLSVGDVRQVTEQKQGIILRVEAGVPSAMLARFCQQHGLVGAEFYAGIPGTIGGALAMNAGAFGGETWRYVHKVETINRQGEQFTRMPSEFKIGYRKVSIPNDEWFTVGYFYFQLGSVTVAQQNIAKLLSQRKETQPIGELTCGSVFCNPEGRYAAQLIESAGLKGTKIGKAVVSTKHANFIVNQGGACARDIENLIAYVQKQVWEVHQVRLTTEVRFIGQQ